MPIMAAQSRSDARGNAQLLASMALESIGDPQAAREHEVALGNAYRLIEAYRTNASFGLEAPAEDGTQNAIARLTLRRPIERHVGDVRSAIENALSAAFGDMAKSEAAQTVENVLRAIAFPDNVANPPPPGDRDRAAAFFRELVRRLSGD